MLRDRKTKRFYEDSGYVGPQFCWNMASWFLLRCKLDAAYFHLCLGLPSELGTDSHHSPTTLGNISVNETNSNYEECYVAFLDLMGFKQLVKACSTDEQRYPKVITALWETTIRDYLVIRCYWFDVFDDRFQLTEIQSCHHIIRCQPCPT